MGSLKSFVRSLSWKEWFALAVITALHVWAGWGFGAFAAAFQLLLGAVVGLALIGAFRLLAQIDKRRQTP